jgi:F0F1-type ATP synthase alpha subunit
MPACPFRASAAKSKRGKRLSGDLFKKLARYHQAEELSHFGSSLSKDATTDLMLGKQIYKALQQPPEELHSLAEQQIMLETILLSKGQVEMDVAGLKQSVKELKAHLESDEQFDALEAELYKKHATQITAGPSSEQLDKPAFKAPEPPTAAAPVKEEKAHAPS